MVKTTIVGHLARFGEQHGATSIEFDADGYAGFEIDGVQIGILLHPSIETASVSAHLGTVADLRAGVDALLEAQTMGLQTAGCFFSADLDEGDLWLSCGIVCAPTYEQFVSTLHHVRAASLDVAELLDLR